MDNDIPRKEIVPQKVLQLAMKNGWNPKISFGVPDNLEVNIGWLQVSQYMWQNVIVDHEFWRALGRTLNWGEKDEWGTTDCRASASRGWYFHAERFFKILLTDRDNLNKYWHETIS